MLWSLDMAELLCLLLETLNSILNFYIVFRFTITDRECPDFTHFNLVHLNKF